MTREKPGMSGGSIPSGKIVAGRIAILLNKMKKAGRPPLENFLESGKGATPPLISRAVISRVSRIIREIAIAFSGTTPERLKVAT